MMAINPPRKVKCVDAGFTTLTNGTVYTADGEEGQGTLMYYHLMEYPDPSDIFLQHRFQTIQVVKKIRCINNKDASSLIMGQVYTVSHETTEMYGIAEMGGETWYKTRFEVVPEEPMVAVTPTQELDTSDWRVWRDHGLQPDECPCKVLKENCWIHRGT